MRALEAFVLETGRRLFGIFSVPIGVNLVGGSLDFEQSAILAAGFFVLGFLWNYAVRVFFSKIKRGGEWRSSKES